MSQVDKASLIKQVVEICCTDEQTARQYLELFNWELGDAVSNLLSNVDESGDEVEPTMPVPEMISSSNSVPVPGALPSAPQRAKPERKVVTLGSMTHDSPPPGDSDDEAQAFYVGGAEHGGGGQQVLGPPRRKLPNSEAFVQEVFKSAQKSGAETLDKSRVKELEQPSSSEARNVNAFAGAGYRLGESISEPMVKVQGRPFISSTGTSASRDTEEEGEDSGSVIVKMWQDGFSLNDGPLRSYTAPDSLQFMDSIRKGVIPEELTRTARNREVHVLMEDHHNEKWTPPPPPKLKAFSGSGRVLGNPTPVLITNTSSTSVSELSAQRIPGPIVDAGKPITQIQVRMPDGSKLLLKLNHDHTVQDLRNAIVSERPEFGGRTFSLLTTFPKKELSDDTLTLSAAQLLNSAIVLSTK